MTLQKWIQGVSPGTRPLSAKNSSFHAIFRGNWPNTALGLDPLLELAPPSGKSWIRHCILMLKKGIEGLVYNCLCVNILTSVMSTGERVLARDFADDRWSLALVVRTTGVLLFSSGVDRLLLLSSSEGISFSVSLDKLFCVKMMEEIRLFTVWSRL